MAFGFDPSIILAQRQFDPTEPIRTFADMSRLRMQQQQADATLADMVRKRDQERTLADVLRQNAGNPEAVGPALMGAGFGSEALDWMGRQADLRTRGAQAQSAQQDALKKRVELMARPLQKGLPTNQQELDRLRATWKGLGFSETDMAGTEVFHPEETPQLLEQIRALGVSADEQVKMTETERHNREMEKRPPAGMMPILITGEGGAQYFVPPKPGAPATPITDEQGKPIVKPQTKQTRALNKGDRDELEKLYGEEKGISDLVQRFRPEFAGMGPLGGLTVQGEQVLGSVAGKESQDRAAFWADFAKRVDLPERNKTFGSSLTATEKSSWDQAKNIRPGVDPELALAQLKRMNQIIADVKARRGRSLAKDGYSAEAIEEYTGPLGLGEKPKDAPSSGAQGRRSSAEIRAELEALRKADAK